MLATLPVPHRKLRRALLERLPRRLGASLGRLADFPKALCEVLEPLRATPLGVCLQLGRATLPTTGPWPRTLPGDGRAAAGVASATALALAADAAREAVSEIGADTLAAGRGRPAQACGKASSTLVPSPKVLEMESSPP